MKIASWNINSLRVRLPHVLAWIAEHEPDVLALQETKLTDDQFPLTDIQAAGYTAVYSGEKTYNGVAILSRAPASDVVMELDGKGDPQRRLLGATIKDFRIFNLYVPNGQEVGSDKYEYKLAWLAMLTDLLRREIRQHRKLVVLGDFNIAPEDSDVHDPIAWEGSVLCSQLERKALQKLLGLGLQDTFRLFSQADKCFSWWDYRMNAFRRNMGLRIDLILASEEAARLCIQSYVDKVPRSLERPSDHAPVVAEFED